MIGDEVPLEVWGSGGVSKARLRERVVLRDAGPWSTTVIGLLNHLAAIGFTGAPRVVGDGFAPDGRESLTFIPGTTPHPRAWDDDALFTIGALLRNLHEATATFNPPAGACWQPWFGRELGGERPLIGHCDTGPWNVVAERGLPVAFIDWEFAGPVDATWELAQTAWLNAQLHDDDDIAERNGLPSPEKRAHQIRLLVDGYGLPAPERSGFVDKMIELAIHSARAEAIQHRVTPETTTAVELSGYPVLWAITWRARSASWMLGHRKLLERAMRV